MRAHPFSRWIAAAPLALQLACASQPDRPPVQAVATYRCPDGTWVTATILRSDPPSLVARRGSEEWTLSVQPSASGSRYESPDAMIWEHQGEARIRWGRGAAEQTCAIAH